MIESLAFCLAVGFGWCLRAHLAHVEMRQRETVWRARMMAQWPATRRLTVVMTDDEKGTLLRDEVVEVGLN